MKKIKAKHLRKKYNKLEAVKDISFDVQGGEIFGLIGPNGSGVASLFAQNSYGRTQPTHWLRQVVPVPRIVWLLSKMAANFTFTTFVAILLFVVLSFGSDHLPFLSFLRHTVDGLFLTLLFTWIGIVFPYSEEYPYSSAVSAILLMVILLPVYYGMQKLLLIAPRELIPYMGLTGCLLMMYLIYQMDHWRRIYDLDRPCLATHAVLEDEAIVDRSLNRRIELNPTGMMMLKK